MHVKNCIKHVWITSIIGWPKEKSVTWLPITAVSIRFVFVIETNLTNWLFKQTKTRKKMYLNRQNENKFAMDLYEKYGYDGIEREKKRTYE